MGGIKYLEVFMKNFVSGMVLVFIVLLIGSCASALPPAPPLPKGQKIGSVQVKFNCVPMDAIIQQQAAAYLLEEAKKQYSGNIEVGNITVTYIRMISERSGGKNPEAEYMATGDVYLDNSSGGVVSTKTGVEGALERAANDVSKDFTPRSRIAIVQITAPDRSTRDYMIGELEYILQQQGYYMVDRAQLDRIFEEQRFGATSDVDDNTAARMGKIAGASIVITGRVDGEGNLRRLRLRALNTETAQIVGTASERL
jgi:hypothetical protein